MTKEKAHVSVIIRTKTRNKFLSYIATGMWGRII